MRSFILQCPLLAALAFIALQIPIFRRVIDLLIVTMLHECGHAIFAMFASQLCVPTPIFVAVCVSDPNNMVVFLLLAGLFTLGIWAAKEKSSLCYIFGVLLILLVIGTFLLPYDFMSMLRTFGGFAGEFILGALLVGLMKVEWSSRATWKAERLILGLAGMCSLMRASILWLQVYSGSVPLPYGAALGPFLGENAGDINKLTTVFAWSESTVISVYIIVGLFSWLSVVLLWIFSLR